MASHYINPSISMDSNQPPFQKTSGPMVRGSWVDSDTCKNHGKLQQELVGGVPTPSEKSSVGMNIIIPN